MTMWRLLVSTCVAAGLLNVGDGAGAGGGGSGTVGPGTTNKVAKFTAASTVGDSSIAESGTDVELCNGAVTPTWDVSCFKNEDQPTQLVMLNDNSGASAEAVMRVRAHYFGSTAGGGMRMRSSNGGWGADAARLLVYAEGSGGMSIATTMAAPIQIAPNSTAACVFVSGGAQQCVDGAVGTPQYSFSGDTNTGIWRPGADVVGIATNGVERLRVGNSGLANSDASVTCAGLTGTVCVADTLGVESSVSSGHPIATIKATATAGQSGVAMYDSGGTRRLDIGYGNSTHSVYASEAVLRTPGGDALQFYNNTTKVLTIQADGYQWVATQGTKPSCSADSHVGRTVLYTKTAGATVNPCVCQKVASTYGWAAMGAGGDCT